MELQLLKTLSGPDGVKRAGSVHDFDELEAKRFLKAGIAKLPDSSDPDAAAREQAAREQAGADAAEQAAREQAEREAAEQAAREAADHHDDDVDGDPDPVDAAELRELKRDALNEKAAAIGIENPEKLANKQAVIDEIVAKAGIQGDA
jgi:flagellum-specific peptidoglycan hydrolase FlgJ